MTGRLGQHRLGPGPVSHVPGLRRCVRVMAEMLGRFFVQRRLQHGFGELLEKTTWTCCRVVQVVSYRGSTGHSARSIRHPGFTVGLGPRSFHTSGGAGRYWCDPPGRRGWSAGACCSGDERCDDVWRVPVQRSASGRPRECRGADGPPLGITNTAGPSSWSVAEFTLLNDKRLLIYTDGLTDGRSPESGERLGDDGLFQLLAGFDAASEPTIDALTSYLTARIGSAFGVRADDTVIVTLAPVTTLVTFRGWPMAARQRRDRQILRYHRAITRLTAQRTHCTSAPTGHEGRSGCIKWGTPRRHRPLVRVVAGFGCGRVGVPDAS